LGNLLAAGDHVAFAMVDVDNFKNFNDSYGHPAGDVLLREVAIAISSAVRSNDVVYRYGGEEFCVLLPGASPDEARYIAERIRYAVQARPLVDEAGAPVPQVTVSVGVSCRTDLNTEALVADADAALYAAKQQGRNRVVAV
jgi:diguanylate cyclase (GGDEF)-like protein